MMETIDHGGIHELRLSRPPVNALNPALIELLDDTIVATIDAGFRAIILTGTTGIFSAGLDVPYLLTLDRSSIKTFWQRFIGLLHRIAASPVPIIAAISGHSPAGGAVLALFCDYRVAAAGEFRIGLNEVRVGLPLPEVIYAALVRQIGARHAERLAVQGLLIDPDEARRIGLVDEVVQAGGLVPAAVAYARELMALPRTAMETTRKQARSDLVALFDNADETTYQTMTRSWFSDETQRSLTALVDQLKSRRAE